MWRLGSGAEITQDLWDRPLVLHIPVSWNLCSSTHTAPPSRCHSIWSLVTLSCCPCSAVTHARGHGSPLPLESPQYCPPSLRARLSGCKTSQGAGSGHVSADARCPGPGLPDVITHLASRQPEPSTASRQGSQETAGTENPGGLRDQDSRLLPMHACFLWVAASTVEPSALSHVLGHVCTRGPSPKVRMPGTSDTKYASLSSVTARLEVLLFFSLWYQESI